MQFVVLIVRLKWAEFALFVASRLAISSMPLNHKPGHSYQDKSAASTTTNTKRYQVL